MADMNVKSKLTLKDQGSKNLEKFKKKVEQTRKGFTQLNKQFKDSTAIKGFDGLSASIDKVKSGLLNVKGIGSNALDFDTDQANSGLISTAAQFVVLNRMVTQLTANSNTFNQVMALMGHQIENGKSVTESFTDAMSMYVEVAGDMADEAEHANNSIKKQSKEITDLGKSVSKTKILMGGLLGVLAAVGAAIVSSIPTVNRFETFRTTLHNVLGTAQEAELAFNFILDVVKKVPENIDDVTNAFIKLSALGITPTEERLLAFSNIASSMPGKTLMQFAEAVADAATGQMERLKEFGIVAKQEGDKIEFVFNNTKTVIGRNSKDIVNYLTDIGNVRFGDAAKRQMDTMKGDMSNFGVEVDKLQGRLGEGVQRLARWFVQIGSATVKYLNDSYGTIKKFAGLAMHSMDVMGMTIVLIVKQMWISVKHLTALGVSNVLKGLNVVIKGFNKFGSLMEGSYKPKELFEVETVDSFNSKVADLNENFNKQLEIRRQAAQLMLEGIDLEEANIKAAGDYNDILIERAKAETAVSIGTSKNNKIKKESLTYYQQLKKDIKSELQLTDDAWNAISKLTDEYQRGAVSGEEFALGMQKINEQLGLQNTDVTEFTGFLKDLADNLEQTWSDVFFDAMDNNFDGMANKFKRTIDQMVADVLASKLMSLFVGDFATNGILGGLAGAAGSKIQGFAAGGTMPANRPSIVGEHGAELVIPKSSTQVFNNNDTKNMLGGNTTNINITAIDVKDFKGKLAEVADFTTEMVFGTAQTYNIGR